MIRLFYTIVYDNGEEQQELFLRTNKNYDLRNSF